MTLIHDIAFSTPDYSGFQTPEGISYRTSPSYWDFERSKIPGNATADQQEKIIGSLFESLERRQSVANHGMALAFMNAIPVPFTLHYNLEQEPMLIFSFAVINAGYLLWIYTSQRVWRRRDYQTAKEKRNQIVEIAATRAETQ